MNDTNRQRLLALMDRLPDLRLMQMIVNAGAHKQGISQDSYYLSDDALLDMLEAHYRIQSPPSPPEEKICDYCDKPYTGDDFNGSCSSKCVSEYNAWIDDIDCCEEDG